MRPLSFSSFLRPSSQYGNTLGNLQQGRAVVQFVSSLSGSSSSLSRARAEADAVNATLTPSWSFRPNHRAVLTKRDDVALDVMKRIAAANEPQQRGFGAYGKNTPMWKGSSGTGDNY